MPSWMNKRSDAFDKRNSKVIPLPIIKNLLTKILVIIDSNLFDISAYKYILFLKENYFINDVDIFYGSVNNLTKLFQDFYNKGYRIIISNNYSLDSVYTFEWIKTINDLLIINPLFAISKQAITNIMPNNFITTSVNNKTTIKYLFTNILNNFYIFLYKSKYYDLASKLKNTENNDFTFSKIIYIYESSLSTESYLTDLRDVISFYNIPTKLIVIKLEGGKFSETAMYYLTYNNISNPNYSNSNDKPLFFLNTVTPISFVPYFDKPQYFDNYTFIGGDGNFNRVLTPYSFTAAFFTTSNYDEMGYNLSKFVNTTVPITFQIMSNYKIINVCEKLLKNFINTKTFNYKSFYNMLLKYNLIEINNKWTEQTITINHMNGVLNLDTNKFTYTSKIILMKHFFNTDSIILVTSPDTLINYREITQNNNFVSYNENVKRIELLGSNMDTLLDTYFNYYINNTDFTIYVNLLNDNYKNKLEPYVYTKYYVYNSVSNYNIPIINLEPIQITNTINKKNYVSEGDSKLSIPIQIPKITYYTQIYYYDLTNNKIINFLTDSFSTEEYDSFEIILEDSNSNFIVHFFRGNVFNFGYYNETTTIFTTTKIIRGFVNLPVDITWLIINKEYKIGDRVTVINTSNYGTITFISDNKYEITIKLDDSNDEIIYNQPEIVPLLDLPV